MAASCGSGSPATPSADDVGPTSVGGVVYVDAGDGQLDPDDEAVEQLMTQLGQMTQLIDLPTTTTATNDRGQFILSVPRDLGATEDLFVQVTIPVDGPDGGTADTHIRQSVTPGQIIEVNLTRPAACDGELAVASADETICGAMLLPDLVPLVADFGQSPTQPVAAASVRVDTTSLPRTVLLRFASATANIGDGPLHMIPATEPQADRIRTWQRIWTDERRFIDHQTGSFVFHESHDHFHLEGFEQYRLLTLTGDAVAVGKKISFCLIDAVTSSPNAQRRGFGIFLDAVCEDAGAQQALNPGWADYYGAGLDDQWIDITGVDPGDYLIEIVADPDNVLIESDETNNRATFPVTITADQLSRD